jgi:hypothetical protein
MADGEGAPGAHSFKYWAFISYSHRDEGSASWLHRALETYRLPRTLVGRGITQARIPKRLTPVFRDREELPGAADLNQKILDALSQSRCLVVICSPRAAASKWVDEEIRTFKRLGRAEWIFPLIIDGEPNSRGSPSTAHLECFPSALGQNVDADGRWETGAPDPIAADARPGKDGRHNALLKVISGMVEVSFDDLRQRERSRQTKRRLAWAASTTALLVTGGAAYTLSADGGLEVPWHHEIQNALDRHDASVLRKAHTESAIREAARDLRNELVRQIFEKSSRGNLLRPDGKYDLWFASQALTPILKSPDASQVDLERAGQVLKVAVLGTPRLERNGIAYGWTSQELNYTQAEATFWTISAIASAYRRREAFSQEIGDALSLMLKVAVETADVFRPLVSGGWNMFPLQARPSLHSEYASTVALSALLDMRAAGLDWSYGRVHRDELIQRTAHWLMTQYLPHPTQPGWLGFKDMQTDYVLEGLTLQIYGALLRARAEANFTFPDPMLHDIHRYLVRMVGRSFNPNHMAANIRLSFTDPTGQVQNVYYPLKFLWYPWAIETAQRWLMYAPERGFSTESITQVRRALGYLVVDLGRVVPDQVRREYPWMAAEILYALSVIPQPRPPNSG